MYSMRSRILFLFKLILSPCANKKAKCLVSAQYLKNKRLYFDVHMYIVKTEKKKKTVVKYVFSLSTLPHTALILIYYFKTLCKQWTHHQNKNNFNRFFPNVYTFYKNVPSYFICWDINLSLNSNGYSEYPCTNRHWASVYHLLTLHKSLLNEICWRKLLMSC